MGYVVPPGRQSPWLCLYAGGQVPAPSPSRAHLRQGWEHQVLPAGGLQEVILTAGEIGKASLRKTFPLRPEAEEQPASQGRGVPA